MRRLDDTNKFMRLITLRRTIRESAFTALIFFFIDITDYAGHVEFIIIIIMQKIQKIMEIKDEALLNELVNR